MTKILITGGAGFIGSNFIRYLLDRHEDYDIVNLDKLTYAGNKESLKDIEGLPRYNFIKGDICDKETVFKAAAGCDVIINFAAESHVDRSIKEPAGFLRTNVGGVQVLLEAANRYKVKRFIQISTDEVYGSIPRGLSKEGDLLKPSSPYSASKAAADLLALSYHTTYKTPVLITRSSNNFGPYQFPEKIIPLFITNAHEEERVPLYADGLNKRDWIFVMDNCEAIDTVLKKGSIGEIYNIGGGNEKDNLGLTKAILKSMNKSEDLIEYVKDRPGHDKRYAVDCRKIGSLGWRPKYNFTEALKATINWYIDNEKWWRPLKNAL